MSITYTPQTNFTAKDTMATSTPIRYCRVFRLTQSSPLSLRRSRWRLRRPAPRSVA